MVVPGPPAFNASLRRALDISRDCPPAGLLAAAVPVLEPTPAPLTRSKPTVEREGKLAGQTRLSAEHISRGMLCPVATGEARGRMTEEARAGPVQIAVRAAGTAESSNGNDGRPATQKCSYRMVMVLHNVPTTPGRAAEAGKGGTDGPKWSRCTGTSRPSRRDENGAPDGLIHGAEGDGRPDALRFPLTREAVHRVRVVELASCSCRRLSHPAGTTTRPCLNTAARRDGTREASTSPARSDPA